MKIAILDDVRWIIMHMTEAAQGAGHEVLGVHIGDTPDSRFAELDDPDTQFHTKNLEEAAAAVKAFTPDLVFIDHELSLGEDLRGDQFARMLGFPREKCVGTSTDFTQNYCSRQLPSNKRYIKERDYVREDFLSLIKKM